MCYHTFNQYAGGRLAIPVAVVTARGKSFRYEGRYHASLERLWDFTIREIVFLGERAEVLACRQRFLERAVELVERLGLSGRCEVATDPFFGAADSADRTSAQRLLELKYELRLDVAPDSTIAVGSFNFHDQHFSTAFGITGRDGELLWSGCVGFGLERLAYAFVCQYGLDQSGWPAEFRSDFTGRQHSREVV
jgi:seryl-tRNA synthetase